MVCNTFLKPRQTEAQRRVEVAKQMSAIDVLIASRKVQFKVRNGKPVFEGLTNRDRDDLSDVCIFHTLTRTGSAATRMALARVERMQGKVSRHGVHTHDGVTFNAH
jgi:hypothetical protein